MQRVLPILNKAGFVGAAFLIIATALAYRPVSNIFSTSGGQNCKVGGDIITPKNGVLITSWGHPIDLPKLTPSYSVNIPAGKYNVNWQSYDDHTGHTGQGQQREIWYFKAFNNGQVVYDSQANGHVSTDIPEVPDVATGTFRNVVLPSNVDSIIYYHADRAGASPESVTPVCMGFNSVEIPPAPCELPHTDGRVINSQNTVLLANTRREVGPFNINLAPGKYDIGWQSWDNHSDKGGQGQTLEIWEVVYLKNGQEVGRSPATNDLPDNLDLLSGSFNDQMVPMADQVKFRHSAPSNVGPQSVVPSCVNFERQPDPVITCDALTHKHVGGKRFKFTASATALHGAEITNYTYDFGDGNIQTGGNMVHHTYANAGDYVARVTVNGVINGKKVTKTSNKCKVKVHIERDPAVDVRLKKFVSVAGQPFVDAQTPGSAPMATRGDAVTWRIVVTNDGPDAATNVTVTDVLPDGFELSGLNPASYANSTWTVGALGVDESKTLFIQTSAEKVGHFVNWAEVATTLQNDTDSVPGDGADGVGPDKGADGTVEDDEDPAHIKVKKPEPKVGALGDRVWLDRNGNGRQDSGEPGVGNVFVELLDNGQVVTTMFTDSQGLYLFTDLQPGDYQVRFTAPGGFEFTVPNANGVADNLDSDADPTSGVAPGTVVAGQTNRTVDAGVKEVPKPVIKCKSIHVSEVGFRKYKATAQFHVENANVERYVFTIFSDVGVIAIDSDQPMVEFPANQPGSYVVAAQVVTDQGTSPLRQCRKHFEVGAKIDLSLVKTVDFGGSGQVDANTPAEAPEGKVGTDATWEITVTNDGPDTATGVEVTDLVPAEVTYVTHSTAKGSLDLASAVWTVGSLDAGESATLTLVTTVDELGTITNWAGVTAADQPDPDSTPDDPIDGDEDDEDPAVVVSVPPETGSIGDYVWIDSNENGVQDSDEVGIDGVTVQLQDANGDNVATQQTSNGGAYLFTDLPADDYFVVFQLPDGYEFTTADTGGDDAVDSDANVATGRTAIISLAEGENNLTVDAGVKLIPVDEPIFRCVGLNIVKLGEREFEITVNTVTQDASASSYTFMVNGEVVKVSDENSMVFEAVNAGSFSIDALVHFDVDGESKEVECPGSTIEIEETGQVLGVKKPKALPAAGASLAVLGLLGSNFAGYSLYSWFVGRRSIDKS